MDLINEVIIGVVLLLVMKKINYFSLENSDEGYMFRICYRGDFKFRVILVIYFCFIV